MCLLLMYYIVWSLDDQGKSFSFRVHLSQDIGMSDVDLSCYQLATAARV